MLICKEIKAQIRVVIKILHSRIVTKKLSKDTKVNKFRAVQAKFMYLVEAVGKQYSFQWMADDSKIPGICLLEDDTKINACFICTKVADPEERRSESRLYPFLNIGNRFINMTNESKAFAFCPLPQNKPGFKWKFFGTVLKINLSCLLLHYFHGYWHR